VCGLAAEHVKVAFSGEGGDELFGGYRTYVANQLAERIGGIAALAEPIVNRLPAASAAGRLPDRAKRFTRAAALPAVERHAAWTEVLSDDARAELLTPSSRGHGDPLDAYRQRYAETQAADDLARFQDVDLGLYLADDLLVKTDRMSMAHSLEVRVPFLDSAVADFALSLPPRMKVRGFQKKRILRRAAAPLLPEAILKARKRGFSIPAARWFRGELEPYAREILSDDSVRAQGYFEPKAVSSLLDQHVSGRHDLSRQIWGLMSFALWHERYASSNVAPDALSARR
jgi:asparagine synthase (glutamine-hydrolysing)